ncbi:MAG: universal stress protein [candidate division Zixibacteria bacterium]|nr:universal stress protein [candidate division Zixibacteria bacterium]
MTYRFYAKNREIAHARKINALSGLEQKKFRILTCLSSPKSASALTHVAVAIAKRHESEITFLHVIEAHEGQKLPAGAKDAGRVIPLLESAVACADSEKVQSDSLIQVAHRVSQGIVEVAEEERCNLLIIGRQKEPTYFDRIFSSLIDTVLRQSTSEVAILHGSFEKDSVKRIVVPLGANIHTRLAIEMAPAFVTYFGANLHVVHVVDGEGESPLSEQLVRDARHDLEENGVQAEFTFLKSGSVIDGVVEASKTADLLLMGGRSGDIIELLLAKSLSQEITLRAGCPVLWVREYEEKRSFWRSLWSKPNMEVNKDA